jgi:hypothetical protein
MEIDQMIWNLRSREEWGITLENHVESRVTKEDTRSGLIQ